MLITGMTGSGKTSAALKILRNLVENEIANLVFDLHGEYKGNLGEETITFVPGRNFTMQLNDPFLEAFSNWAKFTESQIHVLYQTFSRTGKDLDGMVVSLQSEVDRFARSMGIARNLVALKNRGLLSNLGIHNI